MKTHSNMDLDYAQIGADMSQIGDMIYELFLGALADGMMPERLMIWGPPGMGKTMTVYATVRRLSKHLGVKVNLYDQLTSTLEPWDVAGVPKDKLVDGVPRYTENLPPDWAWFCSEQYEEHMREKTGDPKWKAPPAIMLFDDIAAAHMQTQNAFYKGVDQGMWGPYQQRNNVMLVAAGNRQQDNTGANDMPRALASRFIHVYANQTTEGWLKWATDDGKVHPYCIGYLRRVGNDLNEFSVEVANREEKPYACARTWEKVSRLLWQGRIKPNGDPLFDRLVIGAIGRGVSTRFLAYLQNTTAVVPPEEIVKNPKKAPVPDRRSLDALYATSASLEHYIKENPTHWKAALVYAVRDEMLDECGVQIAHTVMKVMNSRPQKERQEALADSDLFDKLFDRYTNIIDLMEVHG